MTVTWSGPATAPPEHSVDQRHDVDEEPSEHFFVGLVIGLGLSTLAWITIAVAALHVYRLLT